MTFRKLYPSYRDHEVTKGFPPFLEISVFQWMKSHVIKHTPRPQVLNRNHTVLSSEYNSKIMSSFGVTFGVHLEDHFNTIQGNKELFADYVNYLLQTYPDEESARWLEEILSGANSEYRVVFEESYQKGDGVHQPTPFDVKAMYLGFRVPEEAASQLDILSDRERMVKAWRDMYDVSSQDYASVVQKSLDELAGAIRDRLYPKDIKTNLSDYAKRIEQNITSLDLPEKDRVNWPAMMRSMANYVDARDVHNSGTDTSPTLQNAHTVLHLCIALIIILRDSK